ncbi:hypothetical protein TNCV_2781371 [Trichonephila clavipes]|nr:hypothetical protein TNCV_2781371 [Trichonephila clavipes]
MHFAIERLFYEEKREMFKVPEKSSLYRKIRNIEVRYIEVGPYIVVASVMIISRVVWASDRGWLCHELDLGQRCTLNLSKKRPPVGVVW